MTAAEVPLTRQQVRRVDQVAIERYGISGVVLMENAGRGAAVWIADHLPAGDVCILCGTGNNGGDGYVIARHLEAEYAGRNTARSAAGRCSVRIVSVVDTASLRGDAAINQRIAELAGLPIEVVRDQAALEQAFGSPDVVLDCLLGTGASGDPRGLYADAIRLANESSAIRVAIDLPSGLDCDRGVPGEPTFRADHTLTFVAPKVGFDQPTAKPFVGQVTVLPIGVPASLLRSLPLEEPVADSPAPAAANLDAATASGAGSPKQTLLGDIQSPRLIYAKGGLMLLVGLLASSLLLIGQPQLTTWLLLALAIWGFCRAYYFAFYVIQHYTDPSFRYAGLIDFARHCLRKRGN